jgi:hypothetical protein
MNLKQHVHYFELFMRLKKKCNFMVYLMLQKDKPFTVHDMEAGKGSRGIVPLILNLGARWV